MAGIPRNHTPASIDDLVKKRWDCVVVGGGFIGAQVAKELSEKKKHVLLLEAGTASGLTPAGYRSYVENYYTQVVKQPNAPFPPNPYAPSPMATDITAIDPETVDRKGTPDLTGYQVEIGALGFGSTYLRTLGGTSMHWLGTTPRHLPNDFRIQTMYGVGVDWPLDYDDLQPYYCKAEWDIGVASNKEDQEKFGVWFPESYDFPMERIPMSWSDTVIDEATRKRKVEIEWLGEKYPVYVSSLPQARNSTPRGNYTPVSAVGDPEKGLRCEGNACCIPICPVQAKYNSNKTLTALDPKYVTVLTQCVASDVHIGENGKVEYVEFINYTGEPGVGPTTYRVKAKVYALAAHAVENAKLLLASGAANSSDQVGRNLMDHPFFFTWALAKHSMGSFRGPGQTSGIESLRDGDFRKHFSAARIDLGNWGWDIATFPPNPWVSTQFGKGLFGRDLRKAAGDFFPRQVRIGFDLEQLPEARNRVTISSEYKDALGCFRPIIDYRVSDYTSQGMVEAIRVSKAVYDAMGIPKKDQYFPEDLSEHREHLPHPTQGDEYWFQDQLPGKGRKGKEYLLHFVGAGHHVGTHRMGVSRTSSVVDRNQRSWDHDNLYVVGCGSLPTTATANPTLTAMAATYLATEDMLRRI